MVVKLTKEKIKAVHDKDLDKILKGLGILGKFKAGKLECNFCKSLITFNNLHSIFPQSGTIKLVCDSPKCVRKLSMLLRNGKVSL